MGFLMCRITKDGYLMNDGSLIPFKNLDLKDIPVNHIEELNKTTATAWDIVLMRNSIEEIKILFGAHFGAHSKSCPINKEEVKKIVNEELKSIPGKTFSAGAKFADNFTKILVLLLTIVTIWNFFK